MFNLNLKLKNNDLDECVKAAESSGYSDLGRSLKLLVNKLLPPQWDGSIHHQWTRGLLLVMNPEVNTHRLNTLHANDSRAISDKLRPFIPDNITQRIVGNTLGSRVLYRFIR